MRTFSGIIPPPPGEESLEHWLAQAHLMVEECSGSNREKRTRIVESLKGPALDIIQAVRLNEPDATPSDYLTLWKMPLILLSRGRTCILLLDPCTSSLGKNCLISYKGWNALSEEFCTEEEYLLNAWIKLG